MSEVKQYINMGACFLLNIAGNLYRMQRGNESRSISPSAPISMIFCKSSHDGKFLSMLKSKLYDLLQNAELTNVEHRHVLVGGGGGLLDTSTLNDAAKSGS